LSPAFRELYLGTLSIPQGFEVFVSPGYGIEVYYTLSGDSAVDLNDTYGYDTASWNTPVFSSNDVPDYIDEVGWALDSVWCMIIGRFAFSEPNPYTDASHSSGRYKVVVLDIEDAYGELYGMTYPAGKVGNDGFRSYIELRNNWSSPEWGVYNEYPLHAVQITCAHEFFHAVQYSMGHDEFPSAIDNFPVAWLEGTAVMMEDLGFDSVNDYYQYFSGWDGYFGNPRLSLLSDKATEIDPYANCVLPMYLYWNALDTPSIAFISTVFEANQEEKTLFGPNIESAAQSLGNRWEVLLNDFHTASFFTGTRNGAAFIHDAPELPEWGYEIDDVDESFGVSKTISPSAMETFAFRVDSTTVDTQYILCVSGSENFYGAWEGSVIVHDTAGGYSTLPMAQKSPLSARLAICGARTIREIIVVVTNADMSADLDMTVYNTDFALQNRYLSDSFDIYPNPVKIFQHGTMYIRGRNIVDISLFSIDGKLVSRADIYGSSNARALQPARGGFDWKLTNRAGEPVVPGTYIAVVGYTDKVKNQLMRNRKNILVLP
jgi:hypothetical protein